MLEKFAPLFSESLFLRLLVLGMIVLPLTGIATSWEGAAYLSLTGAPFLKTFLGLLIFGTIGTLISCLIVVYPIERWLIRDKASKSWKWAGIRLLLYILVCFPTSLGTLVTVRITMQQYPGIVESIYFVEALSSAVTAAILLTLIEQVIKEVQKRENKLKVEITELNIKIDHLTRQKQISEITDSDFFQNLQQKVAIIRREKSKPAPMNLGA
jgi:hypothetical protein